MKTIIFTDLHLGVHNNHERWLDCSKSLFKEMLVCAKNNNIKDIIFLGDFFHNRQAINSRTLWVANELCEMVEQSGIKMHLIIGNHDTYFKNALEPHSLKIFEKFKNINVINQPYQLENLTLCSWTHYFKDIKTPYLLGHFEINGCDCGDSFIEENAEYNIRDFSKYKLVLSGHYHNTSKNKNIFYIGSVMPFTFHDVDSKRGYYIFDFIDDNTYDYDFIEFEDCPKYVIVNSNEEFDEKKIKDNVVKLVFVNELNSIETEKVLEKLQKCKPFIVHSDFKNISNEISENEQKENLVLKTSQELLYDYLSTIEFPDYIKEKTLKNMIKSLME